MSNFAAAPLKLTRVTETKCLRRLILHGTAIFFFAGYGADEIWRHRYGFAAGAFTIVIQEIEQFRYWLDYKRALRSANPTALPPLRGVRLISFEQEPIALGSTKTRAIAIEMQLPKSVAPTIVSILAATLLTLVGGVVITLCICFTFVIPMPTLPWWGKAIALLIAVVLAVGIIYVWQSVLADRRKCKAKGKWGS